MASELKGKSLPKTFSSSSDRQRREKSIRPALCANHLGGGDHCVLGLLLIPSQKEGMALRLEYIIHRVGRK